MKASAGWVTDPPHTRGHCRPRKLVTISLACVCVAATSTYATAQTQRPIRVLVVSPPAGPSDVQARLLVPKISEALGQTIVVDNRPSNNGVVASELCAKAAPDGYTVCVGNSGTHAVNATLYKQLPYDVIRDFAPVSEFSTTGMVVAANPKLPGTTLADLVAFAKKNPGKTNIAIAGATGQLAGDALWARLGLEMNDIAYKGSAPAEMAVLAGESHVSLLTPLAILSHLSAGRLKAYGITSAQRHPLLPNVPTFAEAGVSGMEVGLWYGIVAPKHTPRAILDRLNAEVNRALQAPDLRMRFEAMSVETVGGSRPAFSRYIDAELKRWGEVVRAADIKVE